MINLDRDLDVALSDSDSEGDNAGYREQPTRTSKDTDEEACLGGFDYTDSCWKLHIKDVKGIAQKLDTKRACCFESRMVQPIQGNVISYLLPIELLNELRNIRGAEAWQAKTGNQIIFQQIIHEKITEEALRYAVLESDFELINIALPKWKEYDEARVRKHEDKIRDHNPKEPPPMIHYHPMIHAAKENKIQILFRMKVIGKIDIPKPHASFCDAKECKDLEKHLLLRLNTYKALAKPSYLLLKDDPIETALDLRQEILKLGKLEKAFKAVYSNIADQIEEFTCDMVQLCGKKSDLNTLLNRCSSTPEVQEVECKSLARVMRAVNEGAKKFVTHEFVQRHLSEEFYGSSPTQRKYFLNRSFLTKSLLYILRTPAWLLKVICYIFCGGFGEHYKTKSIPNSHENSTLKSKEQKYPWYKNKIKLFLGYICKYNNSLQFPIIKFNTHTRSYSIFLIILVLSTFRIGKFTEVPTERNTSMTWDQTLILCYIVGYAWAEAKQFKRRWMHYLKSVYNWLDISMIVLYGTSYAFRFTAFVKSSRALQYQRNNVTDPYVGSLEPNRLYWKGDDPEIIADSLFAVANVISFARLSYILPAFEALGPLRVVLGKVLIDLMHFGVLLVMVFLAFLIGIHNLYMFYGPITTDALHDFVPDERYGGVIETFYWLFWSVFGMGEIANTAVPAEDHYIVHVVGFLLYGIFHIIIVIMLINLLIAMLSSSFEKTNDSSDMEWKYARTELWLEYICNGETLPVPFNVIPTVKSCVKYSKKLVNFIQRKRKSCSSETEFETNKSQEHTEEEQKEYRKKYKALMEKLKKKYCRIHFEGHGLEPALGQKKTPKENAENGPGEHQFRQKLVQYFDEAHISEADISEAHIPAASLWI